MRSRGASELCTLIETSVAEFKHVNVLTAFRTLLQGRRDGGPRGVVERALQALEAAALRTIDAFGTQHVSNTLHIMAKSRYRPWDLTIVPELAQGEPAPEFEAWQAMPAGYNTVSREKACILKQDRAPHDKWHIDWAVMGQETLGLNGEAYALVVLDVGSGLGP